MEEEFELYNEWFKEALNEKKAFVESIGKAFNSNKFRTGIDHLDYDVFLTKENILQEYLVVTYKGGAIAVRNCRHNSLSAIFDEISNLFNGGYYEEVSTYLTEKNNSTPVV